jgi:hypothetical protein
MQVITSKETEIEELREQLAETKKLEADLKLETELLLAEAEAVLVGLFCS